MPTVTGLVVAAGSSRRLGQPKQLLPFAGATLLDATLDMARRSMFDQRLVTTGGAANDVRESVDLSGFDVVDSMHHTKGCSSSIVSALGRVTPDTDGIVMLLGDQPGVDPTVVAALIELATAGHEFAPLAVCRYRDGIGHPFWFGRAVFDELAFLHGDKAVWKLIESGRFDVAELVVDTDVPLDVDTWEDYERLLESTGQPAPSPRAAAQGAKE